MYQLRTYTLSCRHSVNRASTLESISRLAAAGGSPGRMVRASFIFGHGHRLVAVALLSASSTNYQAMLEK
jgi:hypothetical protein